MVEVRDGIWCALSFGKDWREAHEAAIIDEKFGSDFEFTLLANPLPTGDHWKPIRWAKAYNKRGKSALQKVPLYKRDFVRKAGPLLEPGLGFCMEITGKSCRDYRDVNDFRMERGHVYVFVGVLRKEDE